MANFAYLSLYVSYYLADTAHLSTEEHGAYLLLLMTYWQRKEGLPTDETKLARIARLNEKEWSRCRENVLAFFREQDGFLVQGRMEKEIAGMKERSTKARDSIAKRWSKPDTNVLRSNESGDTNVLRSNAERNTLQEQEQEQELEDPHTPTKTTEANLLATSVLDYLNAKSGRGFKGHKGSGLVERIREGWVLDDFKAVIDAKVSAWSDDPKMSQYLRPDTLFSTKFEGYLVAVRSLASARPSDEIRYTKAADL